MTDARNVIRSTVIEWLGCAYDPEGKYPGNPDYYGTREVTELVDLLYARLEEQCTDLTDQGEYETTCAYCGRPAHTRHG